MLLPLAIANDEFRKATQAQAADVATTAVGLGMGAAEANPLGLAALGMKAVAHHHISQQPAIEQPVLWSSYAALGWGATANNLCVIAAIATGGAGAAVCPALGLAAGLGYWTGDQPGRDRATFDAICADQRASNPSLICIYTPPGD